MRVLPCAGSLLVALGIVCTGCNEGGIAPQKGASTPSIQARSANAAGSGAEKPKPGSSEYVLTVEGMV